MHPTTIAVDLAKTVFELVGADKRGRIVTRQRLTRRQFERFLRTTSSGHLVLEACASAHFWARTARAQGFQVTLLPAQYSLATVADTDPVAQRLQTIPGVGLLTATALLGSVGHIHGFRRSRHFASWPGLTPREHSSGQQRRLGSITKRGDIYLRCLVTHGARSVVLASYRRRRLDRPLPPLHRWALTVAERRGHNKATIAVANKLARIVWAVWHRDGPFTTPEAAAA